MSMSPGRLPTSRLRQVVRQRSVSYSIDRQKDDTDSSYETEPDYTQGATTTDLALYDPREQQVLSVTGEVQNATLRGLALPSADVQLDDRLTHGSDVYEVTQIDGIPDDDSPDVLRLDLERVIG